jgi:hypothetical protein
VVVMEMVVVPDPVTDGGLKLHDASPGNPVHEAPVKVIVPAYADWPVTVSTVCAAVPRVAASIVGAESVKSLVPAAPT